MSRHYGFARTSIYNTFFHRMTRRLPANECLMAHYTLRCIREPDFLFLTLIDTSISHYEHWKDGYLGVSICDNIWVALTRLSFAAAHIDRIFSFFFSLPFYLLLTCSSVCIRLVIPSYLRVASRHACLMVLILYCPIWQTWNDTLLLFFTVIYEAGSNAPFLLAEGLTAFVRLR
jgi:hypothetical protein